MEAKKDKNIIRIHGSVCWEVAGTKEPAAGKQTVSKGANEKPDYYAQLCEAASSGDAVTVQSLLARGVGPDKPVFFRTPALLYAVQDGQEKVVRLLLKAHADVNANDDFGFTPLMAACSGGRPKLLKLLLEHGANVHATDNGRSALALALQASNKKCVHLLRQAGVKEQSIAPDPQEQETPPEQLVRASVGQE